MSKEKDPAAVSLGRRGGLAKVPKGFARMDPERVRQAGIKGAKERWKKFRENSQKPIDRH